MLGLLGMPGCLKNSCAATLSLQTTKKFALCARTYFYYALLVLDSLLLFLTAKKMPTPMHTNTRTQATTMPAIATSDRRLLPVASRGTDCAFDRPTIVSACSIVSGVIPRPVRTRLAMMSFVSFVMLVSCSGSVALNWVLIAVSTSTISLDVPPSVDMACKLEWPPTARSKISKVFATGVKFEIKSS